MSLQNTKTGKNRNTMQYMVMCGGVEDGGLPVYVSLHWLSTAPLSAAGGTHPGRKSHVTLLPWLPIKEAARM